MLSTKPIKCPPFLLAKAKNCPPMSVAVVNATTPLVLESVRGAYEHGLINPVLVGNLPAIQHASDEIGWEIQDIPIKPADDEDQAVNVSVELAATGEVSSLMKGHVHSDVLMSAVVNRNSGLRNERLMSHVFHMTVPGSEKALCIADAVLNVLPTLEQKVQILDNTISLMLALGYKQPKIALLSAAEQERSSIPSTVDASILARRAALGGFGNAIVDGPLAFDLAVSKQAAVIKGIDSAVAGNADALLVPNIETGNALFKMMVYFMSAAAAGIVLGAKVPIVLTSRADPAEARIASLAVACIYANSKISQSDNYS